MNYHNINTIARYEVKLLRRSWLFRIFALLALLFISGIILTNATPIFWQTRDIWPTVALSSFLPFSANYFYNIAQSIIVIFLAGSFLKRDKKLDTAEVIYVRPMSNADYIIGKTWGIMKVFISLNIIILLITAFLNLLVAQSPFRIFPYVFYLLTISIPSLLFVLGLAFTLMCLLKNQAVTFIVMLGIIGTVFFYLPDTLYGVFDFFGVQIPGILSDVTGHADLKMFLLQRGIYFWAGMGFITFTIALVKRLPHRPWKIAIVRTLGSVFLLVAIIGGMLYVLHYNHHLDLRGTYARTFNQYAPRPNADVLNHDLRVVPQGKKLQGKSRITLRNPYTENLEQVFFYLNPALRVTSAEVAGQSVPFTQDQQVVIVNRPLAPQEELPFTLTYEGSINETVCYTEIPEKEYLNLEIPGKTYRYGKRYAWLEEKFVLLTPECLWYPVTQAPAYPAAPYNLKKNFTRFSLTVESDSSLTVLSQGQRKTTGNETTFTNASLLPGISLTLGDYECKSLTVDSMLYEIYYFRGHDYFSSYFESLRDTLPALIREIKNDTEVRLNRDYPFRKFVLAETPIQFASYSRNWKGYTEYVMPEILFLPERGATLDRDFRAEQNRAKEWSRQDPSAPGQMEMNANMFKHFVTSLLEESSRFSWNWDQKYVNLYNFSPMFFHHSSFIRSEEYPLIDVALNMMQQTQEYRGFFPWLGVIDDKQRANLYLETHSLKEAVEDPDLKPVILHELMKMKSQDLGHYITTTITTEEFQQFLKDFFQQNQFRNIPFETFNRALREYSGRDLTDFIHDWYTVNRSPSLLIRDVDANQVIVDDQTKYQVKYKIYNPSDVDALISVYVMETSGGPRGRRGGSGNGPSQPVFSHYLIPGGEAREMKTITDERPTNVTINTNISHNLPTSHEFNFSKVDNTVQDTSSGIFIIDPVIFRPNPNEIIVDNEDEGFKTISSNKKHKLKDLFRKKDEEKYKNFTPWWMPSQWTAIAANYCYGETVHSAVYKNPGSGANIVEWKAELPKDGYYEVFIWNAKSTNNRMMFAMGRRGRHSREERNQTYTITYDQEKESITLDLEREESGWVSLGNFYLPRGPVSITLTDKISGQYVIADAVKFTLAE